MRTVIVTGGGRGIGRGVVDQFLSEGCNVAVLDVNVDDLEPNDHLWVMTGDLNCADDRQALLDGTIARFGRVDILVNNAGVAPKQRTDCLEVSEESWDFVVDTNVKSTFFLSQIVAKQIQQQEPVDGVRGYIINYGSINSDVIAVDRIEYAVSKSALNMVTRTLARRLAGDAIYVYEVRPGVIDTPMTQVVHDKYTRLIAQGEFPIARWGYPADVALAISGLTSGKFRYSTGEVIHVDGGYHLREL